MLCTGMLVHGSGNLQLCQRRCGQETTLKANSTHVRVGKSTLGTPRLMSCCIIHGYVLEDKGSTSETLTPDHIHPFDLPGVTTSRWIRSVSLENICDVTSSRLGSYFRRLYSARHFSIPTRKAAYPQIAPCRCEINPKCIFRSPDILHHRDDHSSTYSALL